jgi:1-aminocyclopropane-1-carboxylate deaminase
MDFIDIHNVTITELVSPPIQQKNIRLLVARLDLLHPVVSGNKIFKLHEYLEDALQRRAETVKTFGGAYSNHLVATAFACQSLGLHCVGIVRGEKPSTLSHTLVQCKQLGMELQFVSREAYHELTHAELIDQGSIIIPEGGYSAAGARGASKIMDLVAEGNPTHVVTATGTATTLAGLLQKAAVGQKVISVPVIKNMQDLPSRLQFLNGKSRYDQLQVWEDFHFGGYAKKTGALIDFMNQFYQSFAIPTDFVYTAKMMYGVMQKINEEYFLPGSCICCIHTGGLQGNLSLPEGILVF